MSLLTDIDIRKALGRDIVISPFSEELLTPVGYDFTIGDFAYSLEKGLLKPVDGKYVLPPRSTIQFLTRESLWVSGRIAGTLHSRVSLVAQGLSHISTTLDPGWYGPLLITMSNLTDKEVTIGADWTIVTLVFFRVRTPTSRVQRRFSFIQRLLLDQLAGQEAAFVKGVSATLGDSDAAREFEERVKDANRPMAAKIASSIRSAKWERVRDLAILLLIALVILAVSTMQFYWDSVRVYFLNIEYDTKVFAAQVAALVALLTLLISVSKRT